MDSRKKALSHFRKQLRDSRSGELPVKKVSVMADSPEGLKEGLEKAEEIVESPEEALSGMMPEMEEADEMDEDESEEYDKESCSDEKLAMMSRDELVEKIKELREMV